MEDPLDNLLKGNFLFYKIFEVIYLFCFSFWNLDDLNKK
jgi:hypothetical protein